MAIQVVEFSKGGGGTKLERFLHKNQHTQRKILNFEFWINGELSKIGHHFRNKKIQKIILSKNVSNTKYAPKLVFFNEKNLRKIDFESQILALFDTSPLIQNSKFNHFLWVC
jgi:hypothetical protein